MPVPQAEPATGFVGTGVPSMWRGGTCNGATSARNLPAQAHTTPRRIGCGSKGTLEAKGARPRPTPCKTAFPARAAGATNGCPCGAGWQVLRDVAGQLGCARGMQHTLRGNEDGHHRGKPILKCVPQGTLAKLTLKVGERRLQTQSDKRSGQVKASC